MLPRRLGVRFALEALFLVALAVAAGLAHLRPLYIVGAMAVAWLLVALAELTASRIERSPVSYLLPEPVARETEEEEEEEEEEDSERIFHPRPEERTVVAPPVEQAPPAEEESEPAEEPEVVAAAAEAPAVEEEAAPDEPEEVPDELTSDETEAPQPSRRRFGLRRRSREADPEPTPPPRHVKLLPRRSTSEPSRASKEVAELFGSSGLEDGEQAEPKETGT